MSVVPDPLSEPEESEAEASAVEAEGVADVDASAGNGQNPTQEEIDRDWRIYEEHRKELLKAQLDSVKTFETWLLGLSGGALTLSISFVKELVGPDKAQEPGLLFAAWASFGATCFFVLLTKLVSYLAHKRCIAALDAVFVRHSRTAWKRYDSQYKTIRWVWLIYWCRGLALLLFLAGVITLACFVYRNVRTKPAPASQPAQAITILGSPVTVTIGTPVAPSTPVIAASSPSAVPPSTNSSTRPATQPASSTAPASSGTRRTAQPAPSTVPAQP